MGGGADEDVVVRLKVKGEHLDWEREGPGGPSRERAAMSIGKEGRARSLQ